MDDLGSQLKGYIQVTEFEPDVDEEYEEEEVSGSRGTDTRPKLYQDFYVTMDFGEMDPKLLPNITSLNIMVCVFCWP